MKRIFMVLMCLTLVITGAFAFPFQADAAGARWVLVAVENYDGKIGVDNTNKGGVYEASSEASPGSYRYTWTYLGDDDYYYDPPTLKGENSSSTLIPIRAVIEAMGGTVDFDAKDQKITLKKDNDTLQMWIGKTNIKLNGTAKTMDTAPIILNGRTMVPVRFVAENFGYSVAWKAAEQTVVIQ